MKVMTNLKALTSLERDALAGWGYALQMRKHIPGQGVMWCERFLKDRGLQPFVMTEEQIGAHVIAIMKAEGLIHAD